MAEPNKRKIRIRRKITKTTEGMKVSPFESVPQKPQDAAPNIEGGPLEEPQSEEEEPEERQTEQETPPGQPQGAQEEGQGEFEAGGGKEKKAEKEPEQAPEQEPEQTEERQGEDGQKGGAITKTPEKKLEKAEGAAGKAEGAAGKKAVEGAAKQAATKAGGEAAAVGAKAAVTAAGPYIAVGCGVIALIVLVVIAISVLVGGCSGKSGSTPHQDSTANLQEQAMVYSGDSAAQHKYATQINDDIIKNIQDSTIVDEQTKAEINDISNRIDSNLSSSLLKQLVGKIFGVFDKLGFYIPISQSSLENISKDTITSAAIDVDARMIFFYGPVKSSGTTPQVLGVAPIYFGKKGDENTKPDILSGDVPKNLKIEAVVDAGKGEELIDASGRKVGRYALKLSAQNDSKGEFLIIGTSTDDIIHTDTKDYKVLYATAGDLRMFSADLSTIAPRIKQFPIPIIIKSGIVDLFPPDPDTPK